MNKLKDSGKKFLIIKNFITEERAKFISDEFKKFCENDPNNPKLYDPQVIGSSSIEDFILSLELLCEKTPEVSNLIGECVLPTYSFNRIYKNGNILTRHTDRKACEVSLTVHLDGDVDWYIFLEIPEKSIVPVLLNKGDALLYFGREMPHWRNKFEGQYYSQVFLHYVRSAGEYSDFYFDKKKQEEGEV